MPAGAFYFTGGIEEIRSGAADARTVPVAAETESAVNLS